MYLPDSHFARPARLTKALSTPFGGNGRWIHPNRSLPCIGVLSESNSIANAGMHARKPVPTLSGRLQSCGRGRNQTRVFRGLDDTVGICDRTLAQISGIGPQILSDPGQTYLRHTGSRILLY
jgi:hypothetical protein